MSFDDLVGVVDSVVLETLGTTIGYASGAGATVQVRGIFDAAYVLVEANHTGVSSSGPAVYLRLSELPSNPSEDDPVITAGGVAYRVREAKPDSMGGVMLLLHRA